MADKRLKDLGQCFQEISDELQIFRDPLEGRLFYDNCNKHFISFEEFSKKTFGEIPKIEKHRCPNCGATKVKYDKCEYCET